MTAALAAYRPAGRAWLRRAGLVLLLAALVSLVVLALAGVAHAAPTTPTAPAEPTAPALGDGTVSINVGGDKPSSAITLILAITVLSIAPSLLLL